MSDPIELIIRLDDLAGPEIAAFLEEHVAEMRSVSPPESKHALDLAGLRQPEIAFWTAWADRRLVGCCALKELAPDHAEVKSMRVAARERGRGIGARLVEHLVSEARARGFRRLSLETGAMPFFAPARALYRKAHFQPGAPFGDYRPDVNSVFMTRLL
jgi:putative acetyltransferase